MKRSFRGDFSGRRRVRNEPKRTIGTTSDPDAYMGISWNVAPDWRYAVSSILGFLCAAMFAYAATELMRLIGLIL